MRHSAQRVSARLAKAAAGTPGRRRSMESRGLRAEGATRGQFAAAAPTAAAAVAR